MTRHTLHRYLLLLLIVTTAADGAKLALAQSDETSLKRYVELLERQPKFGTVFDKVYATHAERGSLDAFVGHYRQLMTAQSDGSAALIVGLIELQRGHDSDAIAALRTAEHARPNDALPSLMLSRALLLIGDLEGAARAVHRGLAKKPNRFDVLEAALSLGQALLRANRKPDAERLWHELDDLFPNDTRVQERLANTLSSSGEYAAAAVRWESLSRASTEPTQRVQFKIRALEARVMGGTKLSELLGQFEALQRDLKSDSWLAKDVGQRIERLFLRTEDLAGLSAYYRQQALARPDDIGLSTRLADLLVRRGKLEEALGVLRATVDKHPTNAALRRTLISQLMKSRRFVDAQKHFAELDRIEPQNSDTLRGWGLAVWQDDSLPLTSRRDAALAIWMRLVEPPSGSNPSPSSLPLTLVQTAELLKRHEFLTEALGLYRRAVELAPHEAQYREDLGEFLLSQNRRDEALVAWREIASGERRTHENLVRLATVLHRAGERDAAFHALSEACRDVATVSELLQLVEFGRDARRADDVAVTLKRAAQIAQTDDEQQRVRHAEVEWLVESGQLADELVRARQLAETDNSAAHWRRVAVLERAGRHWFAALQAARRAIELEPQSNTARREAAEIAMSADRPEESLALFRQLLDRHGTPRADVLRQIATLENRLGRADSALQAAREMTEIAPGQREYLDFFVNLSLQQGRVDDALAVLHRAVRAHPLDVGLMLQMAGVLATQERLIEAIEFGWRGYEAAVEPREQVRIAERLAVWHQQANRWPACLERLERRRREPANEYAATLSLAAAYRAIGDFNAARQELATQLASRPDDLELLRQLVLDAEAHHHWSDAVEFQTRLVAQQSTIEERIKLVLLTDQVGDQEAAIERARELSSELRDSTALIAFADELLHRSCFELAARVLDERVRQFSVPSIPDAHRLVIPMTSTDSERVSNDWDLRLRLGLALWRTGRTIGARERWREVLVMSLPVDTPSVAILHRPAAVTASAASVSDTRSSGDEVDWQRHQAATGIAAFVLPQHFASSPRRLPRDFGEARIAARTALLLSGVEHVQRAQQGDETLRELNRFEPALSDFEQRLLMSPSAAGTTDNEPTIAPRRSELALAELWEWFHALEPAPQLLARNSKLRGELMRLRSEVAVQLAQRGNIFGHWALLSVLTQLSEAARDPLRRIAWEWEQPRTLDRAALAQLEERAQQAVATSPHSWMRGALKTAAAMRGLESFQSAAELLAVPHEQRPLDVASPTLSDWAREAVQHDDSATYFGLLEHELRQVAAGLAATQRRVNLSAQRSWVADDRSFVSWLALRKASPSKSTPPPRILFEPTPLRVLLVGMTQQPQAAISEGILDRLAKPFESEASELRTARVVAHAFVLWQRQSFEAAIERLQAAVTESPQNYALRHECVLLLKEAKQTRRAIELLEQASANDTASLFHRDRSLIELGQAENDERVIDAAAKRLAALSTHSVTEREIAALFVNLKRHDLALQKVHELRRRAGHDLNLLDWLMTMYQQLGQAPHAVTVAHELLTRVPEYPPKSQGTYTLESTKHVPDALAVLEKADRRWLEPLIASLEAELQRQPRASRPRELLKTYRQFLGQADVGSVRRDEVARAANLSPQQQLDRAVALAQEGQHATAGELAAAAYRRNSSLLLSNFAVARRLFESAERSSDLLSLLVELKLLRSSSISADIIDFALAMLANPQAADAATNVLVVIWPTIPDERLDEIGRIRHPHLWRHATEFSRWAQQTVIPQTEHAGNRRWLGITGTVDVDDYGNGGCAFTRQLDVSNGVALREATQTALQKYPLWKTGEIILALLDANDGHGESFERRLTALAAEGDLPAEVQFFIAREAARRLSVERMATRVIALLVQRPHRELRDLACDPALVLSNIYRRSGQRDANVALLTNWLQRQDNVRGEISKATDAEQLRAIRNAILVAHQLHHRDSALAAMHAVLQATRLHVATTRSSPNRERLGLAASLFGQVSAAWTDQPDELLHFTELWLPDNRPVELLTVLEQGLNDDPLEARSFMSAYLAHDRLLGSGQTAAAVVERLRKRRVDDTDIASRVAIIMLAAAQPSDVAQDATRDFEELLAAASANNSDAAQLDAVHVLHFGLTHSSANVRTLAGALSERALAAAHRTSPHWESAVLNELIRAARLRGDLATEDQWQKRWRAVQNQMLNRP